MAERGKEEQHRRWLRDELPALKERGVLDAGSAERLRQHYALGELGEPRNAALLIFGALGALLVGGGVILIVAHNWDQLGRPARAAIALGLLLSSQLLAGFALLRRRQSAAWTEGSALSLTLAVGASIALISQTYNIEGELGDFVLTWLVLAMPAVYLLGARVAAAACLLLALMLPEARFGRGELGLSYLPVVAAALPLLVHVTNAAPQQARTLLLQWVAALSVPLGLSIVLLGGSAGDAEDLALLLLSGLFTTLYLVGSQRVEPDGRALSFRAPLTTTGLLGSVLLALVMTFEDPWPWQNTGAMARSLQELESLIALALAALLAALPVREMAHALTARRFDQALLCGLPLLAALGLVLHATAGETSVIALGNLYALALGVAQLSAGLSARSLRRTNVGLSIVALLFVVRFLDSELSMVTRGVAMVLVGAAFVAVNLWLVRDRARDVSSS